MKHQPGKVLTAVTAAVMAAALLLCLGLWLRHGERLRREAGLIAEYESTEAYYDHVVGSKEALLTELAAASEKVGELAAEITTQQRGIDNAADWIAMMRRYESAEAAASEEAYRLEQELASLEAALGPQAR
ncbi:MAG: hypothetical protein IKP10_05465 [Clostridia bacterium]|nr:hypothetical protein [Clostridia bacterium]